MKMFDIKKPKFPHFPCRLHYGELLAPALHGNSIWDSITSKYIGDEGWDGDYCISCSCFRSVFLASI
jgi:hypothetical protein